MPMQHYRLNNPPKALPGRIGAELSRFVQHTDALVVTMIEVAPPHHRRLTRATVLSVPFPATSLFEEHVLPKVLLGDTDAAIDERAFVLVKTLPPRPEWKRRWILTAGPQAQIPSDVLTGTASAGVAFHYSRRGVVGLFAAAQDESERLAAFTQAGWSVSPAPPGFLAQLVMAMQTRPIAFQPFLWGIDPTSGALDDDGAVDAAALLAPTEAPVLRSAAELRPRPLALASADAPRGFPLGVSATGQALKLVWNAVSIGVDASGDRLAHALQSFAVRALEQEINVIALLPRDLNVQYALLPLEDAERVLVFDGQNRWKSASLPWKTLAVEHLTAILRRFGARGDVPSPYPATFAEALMAAGIPAAATEALRILTAPEGDDLNEVIGLGNGVLLLLDEPTDMLAADLLLALIAATGIRRPILLIRPEGITLPRPLSEVAIQLVVDPKTMRLMLRDGGDHWMFEEYGAQPVMMLPDLMAEGQAVEGVEEDLVDGLGRDLVPSALPRQNELEAVPPWAEGEIDSDALSLDNQVAAPQAKAEAASIEVGEPSAAVVVALAPLRTEPALADIEIADWGAAAQAAELSPAIDWDEPPVLEALAEQELTDAAEAGEGAEEPEQVEAHAAEELFLPHQSGLEADITTGEDWQPVRPDADVGDELAPVQFGDDDALLDLGALGISWSPSMADSAAESGASVLSLPDEDGPNGLVLGVLGAVEAELVNVDLAGQDANEADLEALRKQPVIGRDAEARASGRWRVTPGQRGRRRMPAVAFFASDESGVEPEMAGELSITTIAMEAPAEPEAAVEPLAEREPVEEAPAEPEAAMEPLAEREPVEEAPAEPEAAVASLAAADSAFAQGNLDAAEAGYRAVIESDQVKDHHAARLGIGRIIAARRNPVVKPVIETPAEPLRVNASIDPAPAKPAPAPAIEEDRWSDAALFAAWSRGESIISLSRAYAAANPALTLAGAMARVREVVTRSSTSTTVNSFSTTTALTPGTASTAGESTLADLAGQRGDGFLMPSVDLAVALLSSEETPDENLAGALASHGITLDTVIDPMTNGSSLAMPGEVSAMTNGSSPAVPGEVDEDADEALTSDIDAVPALCSPAEISAIIATIQNHDLAHESTEIGTSIRLWWGRGASLRDQVRQLRRARPHPPMTEAVLKQIIDEVVMPKVLLEYGENLPRVILAALGTTTDYDANEWLDEALISLVKSKTILRGSLRRAALQRLRGYLERIVAQVTASTTEVLHAA